MFGWDAGEEREALAAELFNLDRDPVMEDGEGEDGEDAGEADEVAILEGVEEDMAEEADDGGAPAVDGHGQWSWGGVLPFAPHEMGMDAPRDAPLRGAIGTLTSIRAMHRHPHADVLPLQNPLTRSLDARGLQVLRRRQILEPIRCCQKNPVPPRAPIALPGRIGVPRAAVANSPTGSTLSKGYSAAEWEASWSSCFPESTSAMRRSI